MGFNPEIPSGILLPPGCVCQQRDPPPGSCPRASSRRGGWQSRRGAGPSAPGSGRKNIPNNPRERGGKLRCSQGKVWSQHRVGLWGWRGWKSPRSTAPSGRSSIKSLGNGDSNNLSLKIFPDFPKFSQIFKIFPSNSTSALDKRLGQRTNFPKFS